MSHIILKTARNHKNHIMWQALYIEKTKVLENYKLDIEKALEAFDEDNANILKLIVHENNSARIPHLFPYKDKFEQLNANEEYELQKGAFIWISNYQDHNHIIKGGKVTVKEICNAPISNMVWDKECLKKTVTWFTSNEIPGLFCWTKLVKIQPQLKKKFGDRVAGIATKPPKNKNI